MLNDLIDESKDIIGNMDGVLKVQQLSNEDILNLIDIETSKDNEIIPVINEGMKQCFKRDVCLAIFKKGFFRIPPAPTILLATYDGKILGHEILTDEEREFFKEEDNAFFMGDDFVLFKNIKEENKHPGKECFILPPIAFPELDIVSGITEVISSSPNTPCDEYLKKQYGYYGESSVATILVAFSFEK